MGNDFDSFWNDPTPEAYHRMPALVGFLSKVYANQVITVFVRLNLNTLRLWAWEPLDLNRHMQDFAFYTTACKVWLGSELEEEIFCL